MKKAIRFDILRAIAYIFILIISYYLNILFAEGNPIYTVIFAGALIVNETVFSNYRKDIKEKEEKEIHKIKLYDELKTFLTFLFSESYFADSEPTNQRLQYGTSYIKQNLKDLVVFFQLNLDDNIIQYNIISLLRATITIRYNIDHYRKLIIKFNGQEREIQGYNKIYLKDLEKILQKLKIHLKEAYKIKIK